MNILDNVIAAISPSRGVQRARSRAALAHFRAASAPQRNATIRAVSGDADAVATGFRRPVREATRDVVRNNATAARAKQVLGNIIVGTGIEPKLISGDQRLNDAWPAMKRLLDSTAIDADGVSTLAALQRLMVEMMIVDGEALMVLPHESGPESFFQVRVLEADYLDDRMQGRALNSANALYDGIEYGPDGRVVAYHLFDEHPGSAVWHPDWRGLTSSRIEADRVIHLYRVDRAGQRRGMSWFAPVLEDLVQLAYNDEAQMLRQNIAASFTAFWKSEKAPEAVGIPSKLAPGLIQQIGADDEVVFGNPPEVTGYDDFARIHLRRVAVGLGLTYEELSGDLTGVNFSSARIGRLPEGQCVEAWQWTLVMPRLCAPMARWFLRRWAYADESLISALHEARIVFTPPPPVIADPKAETQVSIDRIEAGLSSRHSEIRKQGYDPAETDAEIVQDMAMRRELAALKAPSQEPQTGEGDGGDGSQDPVPGGARST